MKLTTDNEDDLSYYTEEYEKIKKRTLFKILLTVFIKTLFESFLQPLLPYYILNYYDIKVKELGILLSIYSLSQCAMCLITGFFSSVNKKSLMIFLIIFNLFGLYLFYLEKQTFFILAINRLICGSSSIFIVVVNAVINDLVESDKVCTYYTYINIFNAFGMILGPLLSSIFLTVFDFNIILHFNTIGLIVSLFIVFTISSDLLMNNNGETQYNIQDDQQIDTNEKNIFGNIKKRFTGKEKKLDNINPKHSMSHFIKKNIPLYKSKDNKTKYDTNENNSNINFYYKEVSVNNDPIDDLANISNQILKNKPTEYFKFSDITTYLKEKTQQLSSAIFTYKYKCLLAICLFRFTSAFSSNLMSNIFFVFYNDNIISDNKQIQISIFVSLSGIVMILYQYFSFSFILRIFGYDGTAIIGLIIQATGVLLTYTSIKSNNLIFQYISICFINSCSYAYIEPVIPTIISLFFDKNDQLFSQSIVSFFRYLSLTVSPLIYSYYYIENQLFPFLISPCMSAIAMFFVYLSFKYHNKMKTPSTILVN
ncbi:major facilitator superfamily, putative [Hepatocystis sp. ex Piliocolobus tephrosceles]|nr:major facilitator superfamily, putative [Hepatocystis sp. ex Piliocolobus tephrosceles]